MPVGQASAQRSPTVLDDDDDADAAAGGTTRTSPYDA